MRLYRVVLIFWMILALMPLPLLAGDFAWMKDFDTRAQADPTGFRANLATRFYIGDAQIGMVLSNVSGWADAYMVFRLGEMSARPVDYVIENISRVRARAGAVLRRALASNPVPGNSTP